MSACSLKSRYSFLSASKTKAELHKLSDESAIVSKLQSTEALVRQQADEKKRLMEKLAYYKSLLEAAGLLPPSPPLHRGSSVENLSRVETEGTSTNRRVCIKSMLCCYSVREIYYLLLVTKIGSCYYSRSRGRELARLSSLNFIQY